MYRGMVEVLGLSEADRRHLVDERGLPPEALDGFASLPRLDMIGRERLAERVGPVAGVPGFYRQSGVWSFMRLPPGWLIPIKSAAGRLLGLQLRVGRTTADGLRYLQVSTSPSSRRREDGRTKWPGGTGLGVPASVWLSELADDGVLIVEAHLKAAIAAHRLRRFSVGIAGVLNWRPAAELISGRPRGYPVAIAYDAPDVAAVVEVRRAREALAFALHQRGYAVSVMTWDGTRAKGIDDALNAGLSLTTEPWSIAPPIKRRGINLPPPVRPAGVALDALLARAST